MVSQAHPSLPRCGGWRTRPSGGRGAGRAGKSPHPKGPQREEARRALQRDCLSKTAVSSRERARIQGCGRRRSNRGRWTIRAPLLDPICPRLVAQGTRVRLLLRTRSAHPHVRQALHTIIHDTYIMYSDIDSNSCFTGHRLRVLHVLHVVVYRVPGTRSWPGRCCRGWCCSKGRNKEAEALTVPSPIAYSGWFRRRFCHVYHSISVYRWPSQLLSPARRSQDD